jgi:hypothetical protein
MPEASGGGGSEGATAPMGGGRAQRGRVVEVEGEEAGSEGSRRGRQRSTGDGQRPA